MKLIGKVTKDGKFWLAEIPILGAMTQGRTRKEALFMAQDLVRSMVEDENFPINGKYTSKHDFELNSVESGRLIALALKSQRQHKGLTAKQVAKKMGQSSANAYYRFESGKSAPTLPMLEKLLSAVGATTHLGLVL